MRKAEREGKLRGRVKSSVLQPPQPADRGRDRLPAGGLGQEQPNFTQMAIFAVQQILLCLTRCFAIACYLLFGE